MLLMRLLLSLVFANRKFLLSKAAASSGEFQDIEGETEERRRARLERHQRTQERAVRVSLYGILFIYL